MKQWSRGCVLVGCAVLTASALAQQWKAELPAVEKSGLYRIALSPELVGRSDQNLGDIRVVDVSGIEVPYILERPKEGSMVEKELAFTMLINEKKGRHTVVELEGGAGEIIDAIHLWVKNARVDKEATITGSDDQQHWYALAQDRIQLDGGNGPDDCGTVCQVTLTLPPSDYRFYRIAINDSLSPPLKVDSAEWFTSVEIGAQWAAMDGLVWHQKELPRTSRVDCVLPYPGRVDRIDLVFEEETFFHREGRVTEPTHQETGRGSRKRTQTVESTVSRFVLDSRRKNFVTGLGEPMDTFTIVIENADNQPLRLRSVTPSQRTTSLLLSLEPSQHYFVTTADPEKDAPNYDMAHFKDQLPGPVATLQHGPLIAMPMVATEAPTIDPSRWWIWAVLVAVLGLVGFMAVRMLRESPSTT